MHTLKVVLAGFVLWAGFWLFVRATALNGWSSVACFIAVWMILSLVNLWVGVAQHGYTVREELPYLAMVFAAPAALACLVRMLERAPS